MPTSAPRRAPLIAFAALCGLAAGIVATLLVLRSAVSAPAPDPCEEAAGDHLRMLVGRDLGASASDIHQGRPWLAGKLEFAPPVSFLGDDEFPLRGGDVVVFLGRRAAAFSYARRLHTISLFVVAGDLSADERTVRGFHVVTWSTGGYGFALASDLDWDELHQLETKLR